MVGGEPPERAFHRLEDALRAAVGAGALLAVGEAEAELGGDGHLVAAAGKGAAEQFLVRERAVDLGGVEEGAAEFDGAMQRGDRLRLVRRTVGLAHAHAAEADRRDFEALAAELAGGHGHGRCPFMSMVSVRAYRGAPRHAVERTLEDVGGRHLVDDLAAALAAGIGVDQRAGDGGGRQALVPEEYGQRGQLAEVAGEGAGRLDARALGAVHVERQAEHQAGDGVLRRGFEQLLRVGRELRALNGEKRRGDPPARVGQGQADGLGAEVEAEQRAGRRQGGREGGEVAVGRWRLIATFAGFALAVTRARLARERQVQEEIRGHRPMKLTWFGHSAFRVDYAGAAVMIDPFIRNPTFKGDPKAAWAGATHVVLSHGHNDHIGSTIEICQETGALLVANPEVCDFLQAKGVENATPINHGGELAFDGFSVAYVPAWHSSSDDAADGTGTSISAIPAASC